MSVPNDGMAAADLRAAFHFVSILIFYAGASSDSVRIGDLSPVVSA